MLSLVFLYDAYELVHDAKGAPMNGNATYALSNTLLCHPTSCLEARGPPARTCIIIFLMALLRECKTNAVHSNRQPSSCATFRSHREVKIARRPRTRNNHNLSLVENPNSDLRFGFELEPKFFGVLISKYHCMSA